MSVFYPWAFILPEDVQIGVEREHALAKIPVQIALGGREADERTVTIRRHGAQQTQTMTLDEAVEALLAEARTPGAA